MYILLLAFNFLLLKAACPDNLCDCQYEYSISGHSGTISACSFKGVSDIPAAQADMQNQINALNGEISTQQQITSDTENKVNNFDTYESNSLTGNVGATLDDITQFAKTTEHFFDKVSKVGSAIVDFSRIVTKLIDNVGNNFPNDPEIFFSEGTIETTTLLQATNYWMNWFSETFLCPQSSSWKEDLTDCYYESMKNGTITFGLGIDSSPSSSFSMSIYGPTAFECVLQKKYTFLNSLARSYYRYNATPPPVVVATRELGALLESLASSLTIIASEISTLNIDDPYCNISVPTIQNAVVPALSPSWLRDLNELIDRFNSWNIPGGIIPSILQDLKDSVCLPNQTVPSRILQIVKSLQKILKETELDLPHTIAKKFFNSVGYVYLSLKKENTCLNTVFMNGNLTVAFSAEVSLNLFPPNPITVGVSMDCATLDCISCVSGPNSVSALIQIHSSVSSSSSGISITSDSSASATSSTSNSSATSSISFNASITVKNETIISVSASLIVDVLTSSGVNPLKIINCVPRLDLCPTSAGIWDYHFCTCLCKDDSQIWTIQYGCFDQTLFLNGEAPPNSDSSMNPYNTNYNPYNDPSNPKSPKNEFYTLLSSEQNSNLPTSSFPVGVVVGVVVGSVCVVTVIIVVAYLCQKFSADPMKINHIPTIASLILLSLCVSVDSQPLNVCQKFSKELCVTLPQVCAPIVGCTPSKKICEDFDLNVCDIIPEVQDAQDVINELYHSITNLSTTYTNLITQEAQAALSLATKEANSVLASVKAELDFLKKIANINLKNIPKILHTVFLPLVQLAKVSLSMFSDEGILTDLGIHMVNEIFDWLRDAILDPTVLNCTNCWSNAFKNSEISWRVTVKSDPAIQVSLSFDSLDVLDCFVNTAIERVQKKLNEKLPFTVNGVFTPPSWWVKKNAVKIAVDEVLTILNSDLMNVTRAAICNLASSEILVGNISEIPDIAETSNNFVDSFIKSGNNLGRVIIGGPIGQLAQAMVEELCAAAQTQKYEKFFNAIHLFVARLQPTSPHTLITRTFFTVMKKTSQGLRDFLRQDFSDNIVSSCTENSQSRECALISKFGVKRLRCFQNYLLSELSVGISVVFGESWFPPSLIGVGISIGSCSVDCMKCFLEGTDGNCIGPTGVLDALNLMTNYIVGLTPDDITSVTCPENPPDCTPGTYSENNCACVCPATHVATSLGCIECSCSNNGKCVVDYEKKNSTIFPVCC